MNDPVPILAAYAWRSNVELIADALRLHSPCPDPQILDVTFGRGNWWPRPIPASVTGHDLALDGVDFRNLPYPDQSWDVITYDPPYVSIGGRRSSTLQDGDYHARYGLTDAPRTPAALQQVIDDGLREVARVVRRNGIVLCKCQDYVSGGRLWLGTYLTLRTGLDAGLTLLDRMEHLSIAPRPQPPGRAQRHARRNLSTLLVFSRP